ncbi:hypothetical protein CABS03_13568 [Colletotrichum abscissum]
MYRQHQRYTRYPRQGTGLVTRGLLRNPRSSQDF